MENATKEAAEGTPLFVVNQIVSMISNKVRNLEKRKVSSARKRNGGAGVYLTRLAPQVVVRDFYFCRFIFFVPRQYGVKKEKRNER